MKKNYGLLLFFLCLYSLGALTAWAHGGDDGHTHAHDEADEAASKPDEQAYFTYEATTEKYELLLRYLPIMPNKPAELTLFISNFATNQPMSGASLQASASPKTARPIDFDQHEPGIYHLDAVFNEAVPHNLTVIITKGSLGPDTLKFNQIAIGEQPALSTTSATTANHDEHDHEHEHAWYTSLWLWIPLSSILGMLLMWLLNAKINKRSKYVGLWLLLLNFCLNPQLTNPVLAHGNDEDAQNAPTSTSGKFSDEFSIPKETQFIFDITTDLTATGKFDQVLNLFGTVVPSSNGRAIVSSPQTARITSLKVKVGQSVKAGQTLAVIEQFVDLNTQAAILGNQSNQLAIESELNTLNAEVVAAKTALSRLQAIEDIAAKKDLDEAKLRLTKAEKNLELYLKTRKSGITTFDKTLSLKAPIDGVVEPFLVSNGSSITAGQEVFTITNIKTVYVEAQFFDKDADKLAKATSYSVECANNDHKTKAVKLLSDAQMINPSNQSQKVLFEVANPDKDFKIGEFVNIRITTGAAENQLNLPNSAINEINGKPIVFVKKSAENYAMQLVQLGQNNGQYTSILKGLNENERIVNNGTYQLKMIYLNR